MSKRFYQVGITALVLVAIVSCTGCALSRPKVQMIEAPRPTVSETGDFTAVAVMDCDQLKYVIFTDSNGKIDPQKVEGPSSLLDLTLRLARVNYNRVFVFENDRACGFKADETVEVL